MYIPTDFKSEQQNVFAFSNLMFIAKKDKPNYLFYLGSETVPPCRGKFKCNFLENVYHLILDKPLKISECQFKILRENSLMSTTPKSIHARLTKPTNKRKVYVVTDKSITFKVNIERFIPKAFYKLAKEIKGKPLIKKKLSTISKLKAMKAAKNVIKSGGKLTRRDKFTKKGVKKIRNGLNLKKLTLGKYGKGLFRTLKGSKVASGVGAGEYGVKKNLKSEINC